MIPRKENMPNRNQTNRMACPGKCNYHFTSYRHEVNSNVNEHRSEAISRLRKRLKHWSKWQIQVGRFRGRVNSGSLFLSFLEQHCRFTFYIALSFWVIPYDVIRDILSCRPVTDRPVSLVERRNVTLFFRVICLLSFAKCFNTSEYNLANFRIHLCIINEAKLVFPIFANFSKIISKVYSKL